MARFTAVLFSLVFTLAGVEAGTGAPRRPAVASLAPRDEGMPDRRGEAVVSEPRFQNHELADPISPRHHVHNEGGSDGAGLCVISSILANGMHQGVPGLAVAGPKGEPGKGSPLWKRAKMEPGGYGPDKLAALLERVMPGEKYASYVGTDPATLDRLSRQGYKIGATMNTAALYGYRPIHHMISLDEYRSGGLAWVVDNNRPGFWSVMPAAEFDRRWFDGGVGWAWVWTRKPAPAVEPPMVLPLALAAGCFALVLFGAGVARRRAKRPAAPDPFAGLFP